MYSLHPDGALGEALLPISVNVDNAVLAMDIKSGRAVIITKPQNV